MATEAPAEGERTKYKAMIRYMVRVAAEGMQKDPDAKEASLTPEYLSSMALAMKVNPMGPTRLDRRFPNVNQAGACWTALNEFQLCVDKRGRGDVVCAQRGRDYMAVCPAKWVDDIKSSAESGAALSVGNVFVK